MHPHSAVPPTAIAAAYLSATSDGSNADTPHACRHINPTRFPRFANDFAESGLAGIIKECGTATHTTATPLPALTVSAAHIRATFHSDFYANPQPGCIIGVSPHVGLIWKQEFAATSERPAPVLIIASTASPRFRLGRVRRRGGGRGYIFRPKIPKRPEKSGRPWGDSARHPRWKIFPRTPFAPDKTLFFRLATFFTS